LLDQEGGCSEVRPAEAIQSRSKIDHLADRCCPKDTQRSSSRNSPAVRFGAALGIINEQEHWRFLRFCKKNGCALTLIQPIEQLGGGRRGSNGEPGRRVPGPRSYRSRRFGIVEFRCDNVRDQDLSKRRGKSSTSPMRIKFRDDASAITTFTY
jgi:hypothetical protein